VLGSPWRFTAAKRPGGIEYQKREPTVNHDSRMPGLASVRRNRGLSLEQISQTTKITVRALQAIEEGNFGKLPGGIYTTSYILQYALAIGFDASQLLEYYHSTTDTNPDTSYINSKKTGSRHFWFLMGH